MKASGCTAQYENVGQPPLPYELHTEGLGMGGCYECVDPLVGGDTKAVAAVQA